MNITIIQQAPDMGGSEIYMANLVKQWSKNNHNIYAYTNLVEYRDVLKKSGAKTHHLPFILDITGNKRGFIKSCLYLPFAYWWYRQKLKNIYSQTDVIVMSGYAEKLLVSLIAKKMNIPVIWFEYPPMEPLLSRNFAIPKLVYKKLSVIPHKIITISQNTSQSLISDIGIDKAKIECIYPGVTIPLSAQLFRTQQQAKKLRNKLNLINNFIIGNISRIAKEKGQEHIIRSLPNLKKKVKNAKVVLTGRGPDMDRLKALAQKLNVLKDCIFLGFVKEIEIVLSMYDVFVFSSSWELEGFGLALAEAMAFEVPIIASKHKPTPEIITHEETGLLVNIMNDQELSDAIIRIAHNRPYSIKLTNQAKREVVNRFNIKNSAMNIEKVLLETSKTR